MLVYVLCLLSFCTLGATENQSHKKRRFYDEVGSHQVQKRCTYRATTTSPDLQLHLAITSNDAQGVTRALKNGANPRCSLTRCFNTPLQRIRSARVAQCLINAHADVTQKTHQGDGLLYSLSLRGQLTPNVAAVICNTGKIDTNEQNNDGDTVLHSLFQKNTFHDITKMMSVFLFFGFDHTLPNHNGESTLDILKKHTSPQNLASTYAVIDAVKPVTKNCIDTFKGRLSPALQVYFPAEIASLTAEYAWSAYYTKRTWELFKKEVQKKRMKK